MNDQPTASGESAPDTAANFILLVFLRVGTDSAAGLALRRALGFYPESDLKGAAQDFGVTPQFIGIVEARLRQQLGDLSSRRGATEGAA